jgi:hypothetical protein
VLATSLSNPLAQLFLDELERVRGSRDPYAGNYLPHVFDSGLYTLERSYQQQFELQENWLDAEHQRAHPPTYHETAPVKTVVPELLGAEALARPQGIAFAGQDEQHALVRRAFEEASDYVMSMMPTGPRHLDYETGERSTKSAIFRNIYDRPSSADEALLLPPNLAKTTYTLPQPAADLAVWRAEHTRLIAMYVGLPPSFVDRTFTGMRGDKGSRPKESSSRPADVEMVDAQVRLFSPLVFPLATRWAPRSRRSWKRSVAACAPFSNGSTSGRMPGSSCRCSTAGSRRCASTT